MYKWLYSKVFSETQWEAEEVKAPSDPKLNWKMLGLHLCPSFLTQECPTPKYLDTQVTDTQVPINTKLNLNFAPKILQKYEAQMVKR